MKQNERVEAIPLCPNVRPRNSRIKHYSNKYLKVVEILTGVIMKSQRSTRYYIPEDMTLRKNLKVMRFM